MAKPIKNKTITQQQQSPGPVQTAAATGRAKLYPVLGSNATRVAEVMAENVGNGAIGLGDLDRVRVPTGGAVTWEVVRLDGAQSAALLTGIIAYWHDARAFWKEPFGGGKRPPACRSDDAATGVGEPGGDCKTCPLAEFGSHEDGTRQACKQMRMIYLVTPGTILPTLLAVPPTSLKPLRRYFLQLASEAVSYYAAVTQLSLTKEKSQGGLAYSQVVPKLVERLSPQEAAAVKRYAQAISSKLRAGASAFVRRSEQEDEGDLIGQANQASTNEAGEKTEEKAEEKTAF